MIINVKPIYGNGWTDGVSTIDEPATFQIDVENKDQGDHIKGEVITKDHDLFGWNFEASVRMRDDEDVIYSCLLRTVTEGQKPVTIYGYCQIETTNIG